VLSLLVVYSDRHPRGRLHHLLSFVFAAHVFSSTAAARQPAAALEIIRKSLAESVKYNLYNVEAVWTMASDHSPVKTVGC
jgi:hypothetical protein